MSQQSPSLVTGTTDRTPVMVLRLGEETGPTAGAAPQPAVRSLAGVRDGAAAALSRRDLRLRRSAEDLGSWVSSAGSAHLHRHSAAGLCGPLAGRLPQPDPRPSRAGAVGHRSHRGGAGDRGLALLGLATRWAAAAGAVLNFVL